MRLFLLLALLALAVAQTQANLPTAAERSFVLRRHNSLRAKHGAPKLKWSTSLASGAAAWASRCVFEHSTYQQRDNSGENLAWWTGYPAGSIFSQSIQAWYAEWTAYPFSDPGAVEFGRVGHFTQIVWKETRRLGCARARCTGNTPWGSQGEWWNVVCRYGPAGNILAGGVPDQWQFFKINVLPPGTVTKVSGSGVGRRLAAVNGTGAGVLLPPPQLRWADDEDAQ